MFTIQFTGGKVQNVDTYEDALVVVGLAFDRVSIGHAGDLTDGGDRTLCWACDADGQDDDGSRAIATITRTQ